MSDITLYELVHAGDSGPGFSPHVWKTKVDLAILGLKATSAKRSFHLIRTDLAKETGNDKVTVPTIKVGDGEYITDSWAIAEYLDRTYAKDNESLFPGGEAGKSYAKFLEGWVNNTYANETRPLVGPLIFPKLDEPSQQSFIKGRFGGDASKVPAFLDSLNNAEHVSTHITNARTRLAVIEGLLQYQQIQGAEWLAGKAPSHADAVVFGWYAQNRLNPELVKQIWKHESLPLVAAWVKRVEGLVRAEELS